MQKKYNDLKNDYKGLLDAFDTSERIRGEQKELIQSMKKDLLKNKKAAKPKQEEERKRSPSPQIINLQKIKQQPV